MAESISASELAAGGFRGDTGLRYEPYWWEGAPRPRDVVPVPKKCNVAIVGSGFTGLSAANTLLDNGSGAVVFDRDCPGFGASTRNGGQIGSGNQKFRVKTLIALRGENKAVALLREGTEMLGYIEQLVTKEKLDCDFRRCGRFRGAIRPEHYEAMARDMEDLKRVAGVESSMIPRSQQHSEIGSDIFCGGSVLPNDASLHPGLYHSGLLARVTAKGGRVIGDAAVLEITPEAGGYRLRTARGETRAKNVIIATNGYTDGLVPELKRRIVSIGSGLVATGEIPEATLDRLLPKRRVYGNTNRVFYYFRAAPGARRIIWGGRVGRLAAANSPRAYSHLARDMLRVFPDLAEIPVTHAWSGLIGYTYDEIPHLGRSAAGLYYALGYCGTGVSRATYFGHKIALQLLGKKDGQTAFDDLTFPAYPAHPIAKRAVPAFETWYRFRDATNL